MRDIFSLIFTNNVPLFYCTPSIVLIMCLNCTVPTQLYWWCASIILYILNFTDNVHQMYCTCSDILSNNVPQLYTTYSFWGLAAIWSAIFCSQTSMDLHLSAVVNIAEHWNSSKSTTLKSNKTIKFCQSAENLAQWFRGTTAEPVGAL